MFWLDSSQTHRCSKTRWPKNQHVFLLFYSPHQPQLFSLRSTMCPTSPLWCQLHFMSYVSLMYHLIMKPIGWEPVRWTYQNTPSIFLVTGKMASSRDAGDPVEVLFIIYRQINKQPDNQHIFSFFFKCNWPRLFSYVQSFLPNQWQMSVKKIG